MIFLCFCMLCICDDIGVRFIRDLPLSSYLLYSVALRLHLSLRSTSFASSSFQLFIIASLVYLHSPIPRPQLPLLLLLPRLMVWLPLLSPRLLRASQMSPLPLYFAHVVLPLPAFLVLVCSPPLLLLRVVFHASFSLCAPSVVAAPPLWMVELSVLSCAPSRAWSV